MGHIVGHISEAAPSNRGNKRLTDLALRALTVADKGRRLWDERMLFGIVRSRSDGKVSVLFRFRYRFGDARKEFNCGTWPSESLATIRRTRDRAAEDVKAGVDPGAKAKATKLSQQLAVAQQVEDARRELAALAARKTVRQLFDEWKRRELAQRKDNGAEIERGFNKDVLPSLGPLAVADIRRRNLAEVLDTVSDRGALRLRNRLLSDLRQMFRFAVTRDWIESNPADGLSKDKAGERIRDRTLYQQDEAGRETNEIRELAKTIDSLPLDVQHAVWIMLGTLARVGEVSKARWEHVDLDNGIWTIPAENAKNGSEHLVFLSAFALDHFKELAAISRSEEWVFPNRDSTSHIHPRAIGKLIRDRQRQKPLKGRKKPSRSLMLSGGEWTPHDLRRTGATVMGCHGVRPDVIERCLNHKEKSRIVATYQQQSLLAERKEAWRLLGERLTALTSDNVIALPILRSA